MFALQRLIESYFSHIEKWIDFLKSNACGFFAHFYEKSVRKHHRYDILF